MLRPRNPGAGHVMAKRVVPIHHHTGVMVLFPACFEHTGQGTRQDIGRGHLNPYQEEEEAASAAKGKARHSRGTIVCAPCTTQEGAPESPQGIAKPQATTGEDQQPEVVRRGRLKD